MPKTVLGDFFPVVPAIAVAMVLATPAVSAQTSGPNAEIAAVIEAATSAWIAGDVAGMRAQYAPDCTFIDAFEPFLWRGPGALEAYLMSGGRMYQETQQIPGKIAFGPPRYVYVSGDRAFVVEGASGQGSVRGKPYAEDGAFAFSLSRIDGRWRITSQTWTKASETLDPYRSAQ